MKRLILLSVFFCLIQPTFAEVGASSQLLYYAENRLHIYDTETEESFTLPGILALPTDDWLISPTGEYLLQIRGEAWNDSSYRIYDLREQRWTDHEIFNGAAYYVAWSLDSQHLVYAVHYSEPAYYGELWIYSLEERQHELLYQTEMGDRMYPWAVGNIERTPQANIILFEDYEWIIGGSINNLHWLNLETGESHFIAGAYYASYAPKFSPNGEWFLLHIESIYICKRCEGLQDETEYGDTFLFRTSDGRRYQVTNDDQAYEGFVSWSEDSSSFILSVPEEVSASGYLQYSVEDVLAHQANLTEISASEVEVELETGRFYSGLVSPDGIYGAELHCGGGCNLFVTEIETAASDVLAHYGRGYHYANIFFEWLP